MGFGDRLKDLKDQAKEKVAENREKLQEAVDVASVAANEKTHGKYANKIMKVNQRAGSALDKVGSETPQDAEGDAAQETYQPPVANNVPTGAPPRFADDPPAVPVSDAEQTAAGEPHSGPRFEGE